MNTRIYSTDKGQVVRRVPDNDIIIEFGNLSWKLSFLQFSMLKKFVLRIDGEYYENLNENSFYRRKIRIPVKGTNLSILLNLEELEDLKELFAGIPENALKEDDIFAALYDITENRFDRQEKQLESAKLVHPSFKYFLN
jgi:hypothetical protein